jgi:tetratricopeptide (TPR) repeat protein/DNA-binding XRE family transcriptional regulator
MKRKAQTIPNYSLRRERELRGWSQQELAERIDAPSSYYISRWERGVISPSPLYRERLCTLFGKNAQELELLDETYQALDPGASEGSTPSIFSASSTFSMPSKSSVSSTFSMPSTFSASSTSSKPSTFSASSTSSKPSKSSASSVGMVGAGASPAPTIPTGTPSSVEPVYWSVPYWRNPIFTGRNDVLEQLHESLRTAQAVALTQSLALYGLGGIGKTQTAIEYAYLYADAYRAIFWIGAETEESMQASLVQIADLLELPEREAEEQSRLIAVIRRWLVSHQEWLVIVDNIEDLDVLPAILPPLRRGALLLTTRRQAPGTLAQSLELLPMSEEEGVALLLARARPLSVRSSASAEMPQNVETVTQAAELVRLLDGLPLALDQAGAYLQETGCQVADYVQRYAQQRKEVLAQRGIHGGNHPASITTTVMLAVEQVAREQPAAPELLRLCACLQPEAIPDELFMDGASHLGPELGPIAADHEQFDLLLAALRGAALLTRHPETRTLSLHRLVQAVLLDAMSDEVRALWNGRAIEALAAIFPEVEHATWKQCERLLPHILLCLRRGESAQEPLAPASLASKTAHYLHARGRYAQAEPLYQQALQIWEQVLGPEHPAVARTLNGLAITCWIQGKYGEAEPLYRRALQIREQELGLEHPAVARALNGLAVLYVSWGKYSEVEPLYQRALQIWEQELGPDDPRVALVLNGLAALYESQSRYGEAEPLFQRALQIWERALGPEHPDMALPLENLAALYVDLGKYGEAESLYQRARQIREQVLEPEHPDMAKLLTGLADLYVMQDKDVEAEQLYQQAWQIWEQALGTEYLDVAFALSGLSTIYRKQGSYVQAESLAARALLIREQRLGSEHPAVAHSLQQLGLLSVDQGKYERAESLLRRALSIYEQRLGADLPHTASCLYGLGYLFARLKNYEQALCFYQRALHIFVRSLGETHPRTKQVVNKYNEVLQAMGDTSIEA